MYALAQGHKEAATALVQQVNEIIIYPLMTLMIGVALLVFFWGLFEYVMNSGDSEARVTARKHMLWGIIGFVVMFSAYAILAITINTFGSFGVERLPAK